MFAYIPTALLKSDPNLVSREELVTTLLRVTRAVTNDIAKRCCDPSYGRGNLSDLTLSHFGWVLGRTGRIWQNQTCSGTMFLDENSLHHILATVHKRMQQGPAELPIRPVASLLWGLAMLAGQKDFLSETNRDLKAKLPFPAIDGDELRKFTEVALSFILREFIRDLEGSSEFINEGDLTQILFGLWGLYNGHLFPSYNLYDLV
eukprot:Filipodium_phascolosomae@DN2878_c0_g1_i1.p1